MIDDNVYVGITVVAWLSNFLKTDKKKIPTFRCMCAEDIRIKVVRVYVMRCLGSPRNLKLVSILNDCKSK